MAAANSASHNSQSKARLLAGDGQNLIFISDEEWDDVWRRNQFLCTALCERLPTLQILFVAHSVNFPRLFLRALKGDFSGLRNARRELKTRALDDYPRIFIARAPKPSLDAWVLTRFLNQWWSRRHLRRQARRLGFKEPLLWLNRHDAYHMAGRLSERAVVYDITDDWTQFGSQRERQLTIAQDKALCARADLTIVCSQSLRESRQSRSREILLLPNGVHVENYRELDKLKPNAPQFPAPVFGYTGTLHPERVDIELLLALGREYSSGSLVLVGPNLFSPQDQAKLKAQSNIHFTGAVPYGEIPRYMASFDVCIVPHLETPFTQSLNPLKLWEYLACGKPIAATNVAGFAEYSRLCHIGSGKENFLHACRAALSETGNAEHARKRQKIAAEHSWDARLDTLLNALGKLETGK